MRTPLPRRNLDVLRAIAVLCVLADHTLSRAVWPDSPALAQMGRAGVLLFFVHTALVLMGSLERTGDRPLAFYVQRAFRIYPLAMVAIVAAVLLGVTVDREPVTIGRLLANLTLTQNLTGAHDLLGPLWSLPLEVQMYVTLPLCFLIAKRGLRATAALFALAVALGLVVHVEPRLWRLSVALYGPCFVSGVLAYALLRRQRPARLAAWCWPLLVLAGVAVAVLLNATAGQPVRSWFVCLAVGLLIPIVRDLPDSRLTRRAATVATYSYGIYLLHAPALDLAFGLRVPTGVQWLVYAALVCGLPVAAYHAIERPGIALGKRLTAHQVNSMESRWMPFVSVLFRWNAR